MRTCTCEKVFKCVCVCVCARARNFKAVCSCCVLCLHVTQCRRMTRWYTHTTHTHTTHKPRHNYCMHACTHVRTHALMHAYTHTRAHAEFLTYTVKATAHAAWIPNTRGVVPGGRSEGMHVGAMCKVPLLLPTASLSMQAGPASQFESTARCMHRHVCSACEHECPVCKSFCPRARTTQCVEVTIRLL